MHGANFEGSHRRGRFNQNRGRGRMFTPEFIVGFSEESERDRDPGFGGPRGPRGFGGPGSHRGRRGRRARRGDIRQAILLLLDEEPRNGYGLMQEVEERSGGAWRPSPGSVYPALAQLEDEGLVSSVEHDGRKAFTLTDDGTAHVEANREQMGKPWETVGQGASSQVTGLHEAFHAMAAASMQVAQTGSDAQLSAAKVIVDEARRDLYRLLAGDTPAGDAAPEETPEA